MSEDISNKKLSAFLADEEPDDVVSADMDEAGEEVPSPALPASGGDDIPPGFMMPTDLRIPKGAQVVFIRIPAEMTATPLKGERQCLVWAITDGEEKLANDRCEGKSNRAPAEYTKQMIRAIDGVRVDWSKTRGPGSIEEFWREIGPKSRNLLMRIYTQVHLASDEEARSFFENCVAVRTVG